MSYNQSMDLYNLLLRVVLTKQENVGSMLCGVARDGTHEAGTLWLIAGCNVATIITGRLQNNSFSRL